MGLFSKTPAKPINKIQARRRLVGAIDSVAEAAKAAGVALRDIADAFEHFEIYWRTQAAYTPPR